MNTKMPRRLKHYFRFELLQARLAGYNKDHPLAWHHLQRAHIIGQAYPWEHSLAHWKMLQFGFRIKNWKEVLGQIPRLLVGGVKSFVGKIPVGNTGGADVPPLKPMPIPKDLQDILNLVK